MSRRRRKHQFESTAGPTLPTPRVRGLAELRSSVSAQLSRIESIETQIAALHAEQIRCAATYVREQEEVDARLGYGASDAQWRMMVAEIAVAKKVSNLSAGSWLDDAFKLDDTAPFTLDALAQADLNLWSARMIGRELDLIEDLALRRLADEVIAEEAAGLLPGQVRKLAQTRVMGIDPQAAEAKAEKARADKHVKCIPGETGTGLLIANLPAEQAVACWNAVHDQALAEYAAGDPDCRAVSHLMCDILVQRLTGAVTAERIRTHLNLVMSDTTLLGVDDKPGQLVGFGPLPGAIMRRIAALGDPWVRRLYADPVDGSALLLDTRARRFKGKLRRLIAAGDQTCRGPQCTTRISDIDHPIPYSQGGRTTRGNGQGLSRGCHTMRDHPDVRVVKDIDTNAIAWTLPSGQTRTTLPPPALGYGTGDRAQTLIRNRLTQRRDTRPIENRLTDALIGLRTLRRPLRT